jgi:sulfhydrogenase subunit beta (sulfur reductase)
MNQQALQVGDHVILKESELPSLFTELKKREYSIIGPRVKNNTIIHTEITSSDELPRGYIDEQEPGSYRLEKTDNPRYFGHVSNFHAWKRFLYPPIKEVYRSKRSNGNITILENEPDNSRYAFIGVRSCDLEAIDRYDKIFWTDTYPERTYTRRRENAFIVAVNCSRTSGTCFCVSMKGGPKARGGYDCALTEIVDESRHCFVVHIGSEKGLDLIKDLPISRATRKDVQLVDTIAEEVSAQMNRKVEIDGLREMLYKNYEHPRWDQVAERCLSCGNCTMVCPTCFCTTIEDVTDLTGKEAARVRKWDSCYNIEFSYIHGGSVRTSSYSRYRQWLMHKLATWEDQYGTTGCVGCGRCITWCPVKIDITEEANAIRITSKP